MDTKCSPGFTTRRGVRTTALIILMLAQAGCAPKETQESKPRQSAAELQRVAQNKLLVDYVNAHSDREDMLRIPMRDGVRLAASIFFPKGKPRQNLPTILVHNPYSLDKAVLKGLARFFRSFLDSGYAIVVENTRGRYFSEGTYTFLVGSGNDGYDAIDWISKQSWSSGKVGTLGCSSSAEEQHRMNAMQHPALAAAIPMGSGGGIGRVGPYNEMGSFYRGGAVQNLFFSWYAGYGYRYRPSFPPDLSREQMIRLSRLWSIEPDKMPDATNIIPGSGLDKAIWTLPLNQIMQTIGAAPSDMDDFVNRLPNDPRWKEVEFGGEGYPSGAPTLYINSWYDVSVGPNVAMFEYQTKNAANEIARDNMFMVVGPNTHCTMGRVESEHTIIGERDVGDARFNYVNLIQRWFDHWLKGVDNGVNREPKVRAYVMGANKWRLYDSWPPRNAQPVTYFFDSGGKANSKSGDGRLSTTPPSKAAEDSYTYDPSKPVPTVGGGVCCLPGVKGGAFDQSKMEERSDVLVYTTEPLTEPLEVTGSIPISLYLSSDAKDTDLMVKLVDVYPDGRAYNIQDSVQRVRWREGYSMPVFMEPQQVYRVDIPPIVTSNSFERGHRIRVEVTSSSFPQYERNLNTGGNNFDEKTPIIAHNVIHHGPTHSSQIVLPVIR